MSDELRSLYSPLSISRELLPWSVWAICLLTIVWTALTAWAEVSSGKHADILDTSLAVGANTADSVPLIVIYSIIGVMVGNFIVGGGIMIMARATKEYLYDKIERQRERLREEGRETLASEIEDWNRRRLEAERRGEPFDEPPPGV